MISQGEVWWADLGPPIGSAAGYRRPIVVVQCDPLNRSGIGTVVCVPLTANMKWAVAPGNVVLSPRTTGLPKPSVANVSLIVAVGKPQLLERVGRVAQRDLELLFAGIDVILGR